jgi:Dullard-like phosphatase family protein
MSRTQKSLKYFSSSKRVASSPRLLDDPVEDDPAPSNVFLGTKNLSPSSKASAPAPWASQGFKPRTPSSRPNTGLEKNLEVQTPKVSKDSHPVPYAFTPNSNVLSSKGQSKSTKALPKRDERKADLAAVVTRVRGPEVNKRRPELSPEEVKARSEMFYREHLFQTFQALKFVRNLPPVDAAQIRQKCLTLPKFPGYEQKKTIIFDLDETLVHCVDDPSSQPDVILPVVFPSGETVNAGINIRPFARECLMEAIKYFEVIVFTASHKCYADVVLDYLDPRKELIHHRLYREHCLVVEGVFMKDLRIFTNRRLQDIVIVDNAAYSFGFHLDNGIPIISWHDDPYDRELFNLMDYLKILAQADDVRDVNRQIFHLRTFYEDYIQEFLKGDRTKAVSPKAQPRSPRPM